MIIGVTGHSTRPLVEALKSRGFTEVNHQSTGFCVVVNPTFKVDKLIGVIEKGESEEGYDVIIYNDNAHVLKYAVSLWWSMCGKR